MLRKRKSVKDKVSIIKKFLAGDIADILHHFDDVVITGRRPTWFEAGHVPSGNHPSWFPVDDRPVTEQEFDNELNKAKAAGKSVWQETI